MPLGSGDPEPAFYATLQEALDRRPSNASLALGDRFLSSQPAAPRYVVGRNSDAQALAQKIPLDGVADDFAHGETHWQGLPLVRTDQIPGDALVANCATAVDPVGVEARLAALGHQQVVNLHTLMHCRGGESLRPAFVAATRAAYARDGTAWAELYDRLADDTSRTSLLDVLRFRLTANPAYMANQSVRTAHQYMEPFLNLGREVFVDAGGFDGDTTLAFCQRDPGYRRIYFFEPSPANLAQARRRLAGYRDIVWMPKVLAAAPGRVRFADGGGPAAAVTETGTAVMAAATLDGSVGEPVTFIKMDLEGSELAALQGSRDQIRGTAPKLAIGVYHKAEDLRAIPAFVLDLRADYKIYLRHYTTGWSETVMFFVPG